MAVFCHLKVENKLLAYYVICSIWLIAKPQCVTTYDTNKRHSK
jgi:hypothetical protein